MFTISPEMAGVKIITHTPDKKEDKEKKQLRPLSKTPETVKMEDLDFDPILFENMRTGKPIDLLFSNYPGGIPRATIYMVIGDPGVGKTTLALDVLADLQKDGHKVLFVSAEMNRIDLYGYVLRYPKFAKVPILFMGEYLDDNPKTVLETVLHEGYDCVLIDSFIEVQDTLREGCNISAGSAEKWLLDIMLKNNMAQNRDKKWTTFLVIQQVTKNLSFAGSMKLKHNTTGMLELRFDEDGTHYGFFNKNRRGDVKKKMYFDLKQEGNIFYDARRFHSDSIARNLSEDELNRIVEEEKELDKILGINEVKPESLTQEPEKSESTNSEDVSFKNSEESEISKNILDELGFEGFDKNIDFSLIP